MKKTYLFHGTFFRQKLLACYCFQKQKIFELVDLVKGKDIIKKVASTTTDMVSGQMFGDRFIQCN